MVPKLTVFLAELKRRKVTRVAVAYAVVGMACAEGAQILFEALELPRVGWQIFVIFILFGFPISLVIAWVLDVTPEGVRRTEPATARELVKNRKVGWGSIVGWAVASVLVVVTAWQLVASDDSASVVLSAASDVDGAMDRGDWMEAYLLARELPGEMPDSTRATILSSVSVSGALLSDPEGASVSWRPYDRPDADWEVLGTTPLEWEFPRAAVALRLESDGYVSRTIGLGGPTQLVVRLRRSDESLPDALFIAEGRVGPASIEARLVHATPVTLGEYLIDRYEVTNGEFQEFVDAGGYERRELWLYPFERDGEELSWEEATAEFVDLTSRPGPSTWAGGTFPEGTNQHPVTGVSWYEAAAYAEFRGRDLPTLFHWYRAVSPNAAEYIVPFSNFGGEGTSPVGQYPGVTPFGVYDAAGNAREWLANATGELRYTAGGGWNDQPYLFALAQPQPPFDRSQANGLRLMTHLGDAATLAEAGRSVDFLSRDFADETPVSDEVFSAFREMYAYDALPLDAQVEAVDTVEVGVRERITFDAAYGQERMVLYLFRPLESSGSLQTIVYFPGSNALASRTFEAFTARNRTISFLVRSGRAVAFPVYKSTFEREDEFVYRLQDPSNEYRDHVIQWRQDLGRSMDYLQTRAEVDNDRFGFYGVSWGGRMGAIMLAVESRFRAAVLTIPGLSPLPTQEVVDPFNFAPRVRLPVLMLSGEYDQVYPLDSAARPLFDRLGTPATDKSHFIAPGGHGIPTLDLTRETLDWFDRYLGEVL